MANTIEFQRGTLSVYELLKSGKRYSFAEFRKAAKKAGVKHPMTTAHRIGRIGQAAKAFSIVTEIDRNDIPKSTIRLVRGAAKTATKKKTTAKKVTPKAKAKTIKPSLKGHVDAVLSAA